LRRRRQLIAALLLASAAIIQLSCATPTVPLSEGERCTRYGGLWRPALGDCVTPGSGGGSM
jgi:hypothetical protein